MEETFDRLAQAAGELTRTGEVTTLWFAAETSDFVRFNHGRVRQAGTVRQISVTLRLIVGRRHASQSLTLAGTPAEDRRRIAVALAGLRTVVADLAEDPHLLYASDGTSSRMVRAGALPAAEQVAAAVVEAARELDLVGFYAAGPVCRGFANSLGQRNWHAVESFNLQWSLYHHADRAVQSSYAGFDWSPTDFAARMDDARARLVPLAREPRTLAPGKYRAYLSPTAVAEIAGMLCWGGFGGRARATGQSCLLRMQAGESSLAPIVHLREDIAAGIAPCFQADGFLRPPSVTLVDRGRLADALVSPRTAREFELEHNGAGAGESPEALDMAGGDLPAADVLRRLDHGIWVGNLWYLNFSDRPACRLTGMTRFGTFWVENGAVVAPIAAMRFDDSVYRLLGDRLEALTRERDFLPNPLTYRERAVDSMRLPGALVSELALTL